MKLTRRSLCLGLPLLLTGLAAASVRSRQATAYLAAQFAESGDRSDTGGGSIPTVSTG